MDGKSNTLKNTKLITYNRDSCGHFEITNIDDLNVAEDGNVKWFNTYEEIEKMVFERVISNNNLDDFLSVLLFNDFRNKVIELNQSLFVSIQVFRKDKGIYSTEKIAFILGKTYIWSIQEKKGDYFNWIRKQIDDGAGFVRTKTADYLFFLILDSIVDNYEKAFDTICDYNNEKFSEILNIDPTPALLYDIEDQKQELLTLKKSTTLLRDTISKLMNIKLESFNSMYFDEIKEQVNNLIVDIDFEIQRLDSNINLMFSVQGHHLNKIMKTLTIFSIIFIPITFIAGVYGMNFKNMPELQTQNGYFFVLGVMFLITLTIILYLKEKKWF